MANDISNGNANLQPLDLNGGLNESLLPGLGSDAIDAGPGACTSPDQRGIARPFGPACDIGAVEVRYESTFPLCANGYTGRVTSPIYGGACPVNLQTLNVPADYPMTFCISPWTGAVSYAATGNCAPRLEVHEMPGDGDLVTCVSLYTGANRRVEDQNDCLPYEVPNLIPSSF